MVGFLIRILVLVVFVAVLRLVLQNHKMQAKFLTEYSKFNSGTNLKLVSAIFYEIFVFSPNDSPSKTIKNVFYFIEKALFILEIQ